MSGKVEEFRLRNCEVLGISTDSIETHERWLTTPPSRGGLGPLQFPLASDADGSISQAYGVYVERQRLALRGLFIIDPNGVLQYEVVHSLSVGRSSDEVIRVLDGLQIGGLCPGERDVGQPAINVFESLGPNRSIGQYSIEATLGSGAFGTVFRARDQLLERTVALKILRPDAAVPFDSLLAEARAAAALNHPNICLVYAADTSNGAPIIVMEFVDGGPLSSRIQTGPLPRELAAAFGGQIAAGMAAAHAAGIVHGDLKPANLMVTSSGAVKITDFGLARRIPVPPPGGARGQAETIVWNQPQPSGISGTPAYMAPEQARGEPATPASDVFAFGLVLYEMLTGRPALAGNTMLDVLQRLDQFTLPADAAGQAEPFAGILRESLARDPGERRVTMLEIAQQLG